MLPRAPLAYAAAVIVCLFCGACAPKPHLPLDSTLPPRAAVENVPFLPQSEHHCGPAALAMVFSWAGLQITPEELAAHVFSSGKQGTLQNDLISAARRHGLLAYVARAQFSDLLLELKAGHPVIVLQNLALTWFPLWHYAVLTGYDLEREQVLLRSGTDEALILPFSTFAATWKRASSWALLVLPPGKLPAAVSEDDYLRAAAGLELAGQRQAAVRSYRAAAARWPQSLIAAQGLGVSLLQAGETTEAAEVLRRAAAEHPESAAAQNNLAEVLARQNNLVEAQAAAKRALELSGDSCAPCRRTLSQIEQALAEQRTP